MKLFSSSIPGSSNTHLVVQDSHVSLPEDELYAEPQTLVYPWVNTFAPLNTVFTIRLDVLVRI